MQLSARLSAFSALITAVGCMLVVPIEDAPNEGTAGGQGNPTSRSGSGGQPGPSNQTSGGAGNAGEGGSGGADGDCSTNTDCAVENLDEPYRCVRGRCVPLLTKECPRVFDRKLASDPRAVFFGAYGDFNVDNPATIDRSTAVSIYRMARDEFDSSTVPGLPTASAGEWRPLVMILCSDVSETVEVSMKHLVEDVEVPAVLASINIGDLLSAYERYAEQREVFFLSPYGGSKALDSVRDLGLLWTMLGSPADFAPIYAAVLARIERDLVAAGQVNALDNPLRILTVATRRDAFSEELNLAVSEALTYNGKSVIENDRENPATYEHLLLDPDDLEASASAIVTYVTTALPHVVISLADDQFVAARDGSVELLRELEQKVARDRPYYVLSPLSAQQFPQRLPDIIEGSLIADKGAARRFIGIGAEPAESPKIYDEFVLRLTQSFPTADRRANNFYDAFYFLAYAMSAVTSTPEFSGRELASTIRRLTRARGGSAFDVGPEPIREVFDILTSTDEDIRLIGTLGEPDFIPEKGRRRELGSLTCFATNEADPWAVDALHDVVRFNPEFDPEMPEGEALIGALDQCFQEP